MKAGVCRCCGRRKDVDPGICSSTPHYELPNWSNDLCLQCFALFCNKVGRDEISEDQLNLFLAKRLLLLGVRLRRGQTIDRCQVGGEYNGQCERFAEVKGSKGNRVCKHHSDSSFSDLADWAMPPRSDARENFIFGNIVQKAHFSIRYPHDNRGFSCDLGGEFSKSGIATLFARTSYVRHYRKKAHVKGQVCRLVLGLHEPHRYSCPPIDGELDEFGFPPENKRHSLWCDLMNDKRGFLDDYESFKAELPKIDVFDLSKEHNAGYYPWPKWMWRCMRAGNDQYLVPIETRLELLQLEKIEYARYHEQMTKFHQSRAPAQMRMSETKASP